MTNTDAFTARLDAASTATRIATFAAAVTACALFFIAGAVGAAWPATVVDTALYGAAVLASVLTVIGLVAYTAIEHIEEDDSY